jgi:hypothetical protein
MKRASRTLLSSKYCYGDQKLEHETDITCDTDGEIRNIYEILVGKPYGKKLLGRPRCRKEFDEIKCDMHRLGEF